MKVHRGKVHKYLGMSMDVSHKGQPRVTMYDYLDGILEAFDEAVKKHGEGYITVKKRHCVKTAAPDNLFVVNKDCKKLSLDITNPNMADIKQNDQTEKTDLSVAN
jgi:hypothetical protein